MSIKLTWTVAKRIRGGDLVAADIARYELRMRVPGAPSLSDLPPPAPADTEYTLDITDIGTYEFELICVPVVGPPSAPATATATIVDESAPVIASFAAVIV